MGARTVLNASVAGLEAARHILGEPVPQRSLDDELIPITINSIPQVSRVGPTQQALTRQQRPFVTGYAHHTELAIGQMLQRPGFMKLLIDPDTKRVLSVHTLGSAANESIHIGQAVVAFQGTADYLVTNIWNYPSFAEAYRVAALDALSKCPT